ncbi:MAG: response regulator [Azonexus sp.]|nr:HD domain-containing phosphohydrolase [Azonexus sp.]MCK6411690.1 response regulator [Azonexus sp.]
MATEHPSRLDPARFRAARILAVDDQPGNIRLLEALLEEAGYPHLTGLTDPTQVLEFLDREPVDLLLLDMRMPILDGLSVLALLQEEIHRDGLQVIVLTAQTERETRLAALAHGARDYITKPFDNEELLCRVRNALETRFLYQDRDNETERLDAMVRERTAQLAETQFELVRCLARAGEFRDSDTGSHILRVSIGCRLLAEAAGLSANEVELIRYASMMHDIGKIGVADRILHKPARLTPDEFEEIKTHCRYGVEIIGNHAADVTQMARSIALTHHERWDGQGYPQGLKGEEIPIAGRITAIIDVYDALTSIRPYKPAFPPEDALTVIREAAGSQFDPELVSRFLEIHAELRQQLDDLAHDNAAPA